MKVQITAIRMADGEDHHEHIERVRWHELDNEDNTGESSREEMVEFLSQPENSACVVPLAIDVGVVHAELPHIRTYPDDTPRDDLLALPRF